MVVYSVASSKAVICSRCLFSTALGFRIKGLLGRESLGKNEGILLRPCNSIHMFFMNFAIDALFLDKEDRILHISHSIKPWRISRLIFKSVSVLEVAEGTAVLHGLKPGDQLNFTLQSEG